MGGLIFLLNIELVGCIPSQKNWRDLLVDGNCVYMRFPFLAFVHFVYQKLHGSVGYNINLLTDGGDRYDGILGNRGTIETNYTIAFWQRTIFFDNNIQQNICKCIIGYEDSFLLSWILFFYLAEYVIYFVVRITVCVAQFSKKQLICYILLTAHILKGCNSFVAWYLL